MRTTEIKTLRSITGIKLLAHKRNSDRNATRCRVWSCELETENDNGETKDERPKNCLNTKSNSYQQEGDQTDESTHEHPYNAIR